jgi:hypothetical protein
MATGGPAGTGGSGGTYDPRYDPAFQRGFDGSGREAGGIGARPPGSADPLGEARAHLIEPEAAHPGSGESSWFSGSGAAIADVTPATPPAEEPPGDAAADERAAASRAHAHRMWTAYTVGLSALSAACMAFGVVLVTRAYGVFNSTTVDSRDDIYWAQLGGQFGPWVFVVGLATGIGVIFLHAARWRPPHG